MDYSKMSDFEINSAVHNALMKEPYKLEFLGNDKIRWTKKGSDVVTEKVAYGKTTLKDYCNNPADAWPIIVENRISIAFDKNEDEWVAWGDFAFDLAGWDMKEQPAEYEHHQNPLRAAMLVYLQLQEAK